MKHKATKYGLAAGLAAMGGVAATALAADWPQWGGDPDKNMVNTREESVPSEWDVGSGKNVKWMAQLGSQSYGNPTVHEGKVFVGTNNGAERDPEVTGDKGVVMAFDEETGEFLWQAAHDKLPSGRVNDWPEQGVCSTIAAEGDRIWYISNRCEVISSDTEGFRDGENDGPYTDEERTGEIHEDIVWKYDMMNELGVFPHNLATSSPLLVGDTIYVITSNGVDEGHLFIPSPRAPSFIAIDKNTGELKWEHPGPGKDILHGQWSSPSYGEVDGKGQVYFAAGDGWIYAVDPESGETIWKFDCNPKDSVWELGGRGTRNNIIGTPVFHEGHVYIGVGQDPEHGIGPGHFYKIDASGTGDVTETHNVWQFDELTRTISTAAVHEGVVYISDLNGFLYALDDNDGKKLWEYDTLAAVWSSPTIIGGRLFMADEDGDVAVLEPGREKKILAENNMHNSVYTTPVGANGTLFVANRSELYAIEEGAQLTEETTQASQ